MEQVKESLSRRNGSQLLSAILCVPADDSMSKFSEYLEIISQKEFQIFWALLEEEVDRLNGEISQENLDELDKLHKILDLVKLSLKVTKHRGDAYFRVIESLHNLLQTPTSPNDMAADNIASGSTSNPSMKSLILLKNNIALFCEHYYLQHEFQHEELFPQLVLYLLIEALTPGCKETLIKRLYHLRNGFLHLDLLTASSTTFSQDLLLRCFVHPLFLKSTEGQKLLGTLLLISDGFLLPPIINIIKSQVNTGNQTVGDCYGLVLQHAWKYAQEEALALAKLTAAATTSSSADATNNTNTKPTTTKGSKGSKNKHAETQEAASTSQAKKPVDLPRSPVIEELEQAIQDLLYEAIHTSSPKAFKGLRVVMKSFHDIKRTEALDMMLVTIFEPILWRSLKCANAIVRLQASVIFLDVFPLQKPANVTTTSAALALEETDQYLQKQFDSLISLLKDIDHRVRTTGTLGVCHILRDYWDSLPIVTIKHLLKYLVDSLAFDAASVHVRHATITGIQEILEQPLSHKLLKHVLPALAPSIHDKSEKVRIAYLQLLVQVKTIRNIHYYDIISPPHLLARLIEDRGHPVISSLLTELLLPSFYPTTAASSSQADRQEQIQRCLQFIVENLVAAESFYASLSSHIPLGSVTKFVVMLFSLLESNVSRLVTVSCPKTGTGNNSSGNGNAAKRKRGTQKETAPDDDAVGSDEQTWREYLTTTTHVQDLVITWHTNGDQEGGDHVSEEDKTLFYGITRIIFVLFTSVQSSLRSEWPCLQLLFKYFSLAKVLPWYFAMTHALFPTDLVMQVTLMDIIGLLAQFAGDAQRLALEQPTAGGGVEEGDEEEGTGGKKKGKKAAAKKKSAASASQPNHALANEYATLQEQLTSCFTPAIFFSSLSPAAVTAAVTSTEASEEQNVWQWFYLSAMKVSFTLQHQVEVIEFLQQQLSLYITNTTSSANNSTSKAKKAGSDTESPWSLPHLALLIHVLITFLSDPEHSSLLSAPAQQALTALWQTVEQLVTRVYLAPTSSSSSATQKLSPAEVNGCLVCVKALMTWASCVDITALLISFPSESSTAPLPQVAAGITSLTKHSPTSPLATARLVTLLLTVLLVLSDGILLVPDYSASLAWFTQILNLLTQIHSLASPSTSGSPSPAVLPAHAHRILTRLTQLCLKWYTLYEKKHSSTSSLVTASLLTKLCDLALLCDATVAGEGEGKEYEAFRKTLGELLQLIAQHHSKSLPEEEKEFLGEWWQVTHPMYAAACQTLLSSEEYDRLLQGFQSSS